MQTPEAVFLIIDSRAYKKYKPWLIVVFMVTYFLAIVFTIPVYLVIIIFALNVWSLGYMKWSSRNWEGKGQLTFQPEHLVIQKAGNEPMLIPISEAKEFRVSRGAEIHREKLSFFPETHDNWITFAYQEQTYSFEFCIRNKKENEWFEKRIREWRERYPSFYYTSV